MVIASLLAAASVSCPPADLPALAARYKGRAPTKIVFFASWCAACKAHFEEKHPDGTLFVAAFDERARAEEAARALGLKHACFTDAGSIAGALGVAALPAVKEVRF